MFFMWAGARNSFTNRTTLVSCGTDRLSWKGGLLCGNSPGVDEIQYPQGKIVRRCLWRFLAPGAWPHVARSNPKLSSEQAMPDLPVTGRICPHCGARTPSDFSLSYYDFQVSNDAPPALQGLSVLLQHINSELERAALETDALGQRLADMRGRLQQARKLIIKLENMDGFEK